MGPSLLGLLITQYLSQLVFTFTYIFRDNKLLENVGSVKCLETTVTN
jgi:hypothetical protein